MSKIQDAVGSRWGNTQDLLHFLLIILFEVCLYQFFFLKHYSSDCYIVLYDQKNVMVNYASTGRPLSALFVFLAGRLGINLVRSQIIFTAISVFILSLAIFYISKAALTLKGETSVYYRIFFTLSAVLIFNNIFSIEHFVFSFQTPLFSIAMLLAALSAGILLKGTSPKRVLLYTITVSTVGFIYQGFGGVFVPLALVFLLYQSGDSWKKYAVSAGWVLTAYFVSLLLNAAYIKIVDFFSLFGHYRDFNAVNLEKIMGNITHIIKNQQDVWITHCNMLPKYFFLLSVIAAIILYAVTRKDPLMEKMSTLGLLAVVLSAVFVSFVPHIPSPSIGLAPRALTGISALPGLIFYAALLIRRTKHESLKEDVFIGGTMLIIAAVLFVYTNRIAADHIYTNRMDRQYARLVIQEISSQEEKAGVTVSKLAFVPDKYPTYCYEGAICYDFLNLSIRNVRWGFPYLLKMVSGRNGKVVEMDPSVYETFFKDKNWDNFDKEQVVVKNDTAYVVTY